MGKLVFMYWKSIIIKARKKMWRKLGIWGLLFSSILSGVYALYVGEQVFSLGGILVFAKVLLFLIILAWVIFVIKVAATQDRSQREKIEKHESIERFKQARNIKLSEVNKDNYAYIKVWNRDKKHTFKGQLILTELNGKPLDDIHELGKFVGNVRSSKLEWLPDTPHSIELGTIDSDSKNAYVISSESGKWKPLDSGEHKLKTQLSGWLGEHEINPKTRKWILIVDKENVKIELKMVKNRRR